MCELTTSWNKERSISLLGSVVCCVLLLSQICFHEKHKSDYFSFTHISKILMTISSFKRRGDLGLLIQFSPILFIEVPVPSQESERSYICVSGISILPLSTIFLLNFRTVPTVLFFILLLEQKNGYFLQFVEHCWIRKFTLITSFAYFLSLFLNFATF